MFIPWFKKGWVMILVLLLFVLVFVLSYLASREPESTGTVTIVDNSDGHTVAVMTFPIVPTVIQ